MPLVCFASPKGGVGKTTLAANVAAELARAGRRVIALDLDPQNALRLHFGATLHDRSGYTHRLTHAPDWRLGLQKTSVDVALLPHGQIDMMGARQLTQALMRQPDILVTPLTEMLADPDLTIVVDTMPGLSVQLAIMLPFIDLLITVLLPDAASVSLIPQIHNGAIFGSGLGALAQLGDGEGRMGLVLNQIDPRSRLNANVTEAVGRHFDGQLLGSIYRDESVAEALAVQKLVANYAPASKAARDIALLAEEIQQRLVPVQAKRPAWARPSP